MGGTSGPPTPRLRSTTGWSFVMEGSRQSVTLLSGLFLASLLGPGAFGLSAMAFAFIAFFDLLQRQGLAPAVIQRPNLTDGQRDTAFWLQVLASLPATVLSVSLAGWWAGANDEPELQYVIYGLTPVLVLHALSAIPESVLLRERRMRSMAMVAVVSVVAGGTAGIVGALAGLGVWALVLQQVVTALVTTLLIWVASDWRPSNAPTRQQARDLLGFSSWVFLNSLSNFVASRGDAIILGLFVNSASVGFYRLAARLVESTLSLASQPIQVIALSSLSKWQDSRAALSRTYGQLTRVSSTAALPSLAILAACAEPMMMILGEEWVPATRALQWLALAGAIKSLTIADSPMLQSMGRPHLATLLGVSGMVARVIILVAAGMSIPSPDWPDAATTMAAASAASMLLIGVVRHLAFLRIVDIPLVDSVKQRLPAIGIALATGMVAASVVAWLTALGFSPWLTLFAGAGTGLVAGAGAAMIDPFIRGLVLQMLRKRLR